MSERRNDIPVDSLVRRVKALKLTPEAIIKRFGKTGNASAVAGIERHCAEMENPSEDKIAAADYARYVEAD